MACADAARMLGLGTWVTGGSDGLGLGTWVTRGSEGGAEARSDAGGTVCFGTVGAAGTVCLTGLGRGVGGGAVVGFACFGSCMTGAPQAAGLGMINAGFFLPGVSTALR